MELFKNLQNLCRIDAVIYVIYIPLCMYVRYRLFSNASLAYKPMHVKAVSIILYFSFLKNSLARSLRNFEFIQNVKFEARSMQTATIRKSFPHLRILARTTNTTSKTVFSIYSIKIRYYVCEKRTIYNTELSHIYSSTTNISQLVQCPDNALASDGKSTNITVQCTPKGDWTFGDLKCVCDKGFFSSNQAECLRKYRIN